MFVSTDKNVSYLPKVLKKSNFFLATICIVLFTSSIFTSFESILRYIKYLLFPIVFFMILVILKKLYVNKLILKNLTLYIGLIAVNFIFSLFFNLISIRFFEEAILILLPICTAFIVSGIKVLNKAILIRYLFYTYASSFVLFFSNEFLNISKLVSNIIIALKFSIFPTESWHAFLFGLFALYFIIEKNKIHALIAIVLFIFAFKRISFVAFIIALIVFVGFYGIKRINFSKTKTVFYFMFLNVSLIGILFFFINGSFSRLIYKETGLNINHFSQGRFRIYNDALTHFSDRIWLGSSLGSTYNFIDNKYDNVSFLHSDILKIIIELGIISFVIWLFLFLYFNLANKKAIPIVLYMNVLFLSDNVFIYFDTLLLFYLILSKFHEDHQNI